MTAVDEDGVDLSDTSNTQTVDLSDVSTPLTIVKSTESASTLPEPGGDFDFKGGHEPLDVRRRHRLRPR